MAQETKQFYEFGPYRIDPEERLLFRGSEPVPLPPKAFETLLILVNRSERVVLKDDLMRALWPDTFVEEANLSQNIFVLRKALGETAQDARYIVTVPGRGYRFAEKARSVPAQPPPADELVVDAHSRVQLTVKETVITRTSRYIWLGLAALVAGGLVASYASLRHRAESRGSGPMATAAPVFARHSVAVLGFRNLSAHPEDAWLSTAFAEMLNTELAAGEKLRLVPSEDVARTRLDLPLSDADTLSKDTLARIRSNLGTDYVILGSYTAVGNAPGKRLRLDLRLQDTAAGETVAEVAATGTEADLFDLASQAGVRLREKLGVNAVSSADAVSVRASLPSSPEAARLYAMGLAKLRVFDTVAARDLLEEAVNADPKYPLAHAALAEALADLGYEPRARQEANKAFQLSGNLTREEKLSVEGHYREINHELDKAIEIYRKLFTLFPDNIDYGLRLASVQDDASKGQDALATLAQVRKIPAPASDDPRIDEMESEAAREIGDFPRSEASARKSAEKSEAMGAKLLVARARHVQCWGAHKIGQQQEAQAACEEARSLFAAAGDLDSVASLLVTWGAVVEEQGDLAAAQSRYEEAIARYKQSGDRGGAAVAYNNLAIVYRHRGNYAQAEAMYKQAIGIAKEIDDNDTLMLAKSNLGELFFHEADMSRALATFQELLAACRELGAKDRTALQLDNVGETLYRQGDLAGAAKALEEARALNTQADEKRQLSNNLVSLGDVLEAEGKLAEARQRRYESLNIRNVLGNKTDIADTRVALAESSLEEGQAVEAEGPVRQSIAELHALHEVEDEAWAYSVLARALLDAGKPADALKAIEGGIPILAMSQDRNVYLGFSITEARVRAANGDTAKSIQTLRRIRAEAEKHGLFTLAIEARLALGELEMRAGNVVSARSQLTSLENDARAKGFLLVAQKAATARQVTQARN
ncbi:MAG TPA: tetratricopeptide repeat protein [Candidatus Nitrosotalea sp.]|nr:tetratricopeptide repeat protein [Candidatus Nitrosotalea sp.]